MGSTSTISAHSARLVLPLVLNVLNVLKGIVRGRGLPMYRSRIVLPTLRVLLFFPYAPPQSAAWKRRFRRALFELRSGARGVRPPPGRVAQPRLLAADRGNPAGAANRGRLLFGYFFLATQEKVTSCRSATGGVGFLHDKTQGGISAFLPSPQPSPCKGEGVDGCPASTRRPFDKLSTNGHQWIKRCQCRVSAT